MVVTPNMSLTGVAIGAHLEGRFHVPVALGNDCNLGALGETWLGSARNAQQRRGHLRRHGHRRRLRAAKASSGAGPGNRPARSATSIMQIGGPQCGCGNRGCLEALASRTAIERELRAAVAAGAEDHAGRAAPAATLSVIRSGMIRKALDAEDALVTEVVRRAAEVLGYACLNVRHLIDPEVIVLGGGVIEACSDFILPIVENIVGSDQLPGAREGGRVLLSALGDDAVVLGAVALARTLVGRSPFKKRYAVSPSYASITGYRFGEITIGQKAYGHDVYILVDGTVKKRKKTIAREEYHTAHTLGPKELERVCQAGPEVLFVGTGETGAVKVSEDALRYLSQRSIDCKALPTPQAIEAYNKSTKRKAAVIHVTC